MVCLQTVAVGLLRRAMAASRQGDAASVGRDPVPGREKSDEEGTEGGSHRGTRSGKKVGLGGLLVEDHFHPNDSNQI